MRLCLFCLVRELNARIVGMSTHIFVYFGFLGGFLFGSCVEWEPSEGQKPYMSIVWRKFIIPRPFLFQTQQISSLSLSLVLGRKLIELFQVLSYWLERWCKLVWVVESLSFRREIRVFALNCDSSVTPRWVDKVNNQSKRLMMIVTNSCLLSANVRNRWKLLDRGLHSIRR